MMAPTSSSSSNSASAAAAAALSASASATEKDKDSMWYFSSEQLQNSPSRRHGIDADQELSYRQMTAYLIQEMGQRLQVSQLCINTAIVYMHRFYAFHSFTHFHRNGIAAASLFLAAKVEEQPRKLEHVIKASNKCLNMPSPAVNDQHYMEQAQDLVFNENVLLQTLGFDVAIDHPHTHVVKTCHLVKACKDLAQTSYFLASNSLHLTSMCLQYRPTVVACFCIYLACKWSRWEIPQSTEGKHWFYYVDRSVTMELLKQLTDEFIAIYEKSPARLKSKLNSIKALAQGATNRSSGSNGGGNGKDKKAQEDWKMGDMMKIYHSNINTNDTNGQPQGNGNSIYSDQPQQVGSLLPPPPPQQQGQQQQQMMQQQMRKSSDMHSSQHRSHHSSSSTASSSSTSHHHVNKHGYGSGDVTDHKSSHKQQQQQQQYGSSNSLPSLNRASRDHSQSSSQSHSSAMSISNSSRSGMPGSSSRSSLPNAQSRSQQQQQLPTVGGSHQMDINYHKPRTERMSASGMMSSSSSAASSQHAHKMSMSKEASSSSSTSSSRAIPPNLQQSMGKSSMSSSSSGSNSGMGKMYPPSSSGANIMSVQPPAYGSQLSSNAQSSSLMHNQRSSYGSGNNMAAVGISGQAGGYHQSTTSAGLGMSQQQQMQRPNNLTNSGSKHEAQKSLSSVHLQSQQQQLHKQSMLNESNYGTSSLNSLDQQLGYASQNMRSHTETHAEDQQQLPQYQHSSNPGNSVKPSSMSSAAMFGSGEMLEKSTLQNINAYNNGSNMMAGTNQQHSYDQSFGGYKIPKDSPSKRDTPTKKDKNRNSQANQLDALQMPSRASNAAQQQQQQSKALAGYGGQQRKAEGSSSSSHLNELAGSSMTGSMKRPIESMSFKSEEELQLRDSKMRKMENAGLSSSSLQFPMESKPDLSKIQVVNGIETNPALVSSLLKESLGSSSLFKTEPITNPSLQPPAELFAPAPSTSAIKRENEPSTSTSNMETLNSTADEASAGSKSKKAKKEKHKHKEKDKSKDKEERKKHKKDKDRHKDRERDSDNGNNNESVKLKINAPSGSGEHIALKIKIPKERITGDLNNSGGSSNAMENAPATGLKIKISKDKLENYSSGSSSQAHLHQHQVSNSAGLYAPMAMANPHANNSNSTSSSKRKDRDRDRERDKDKRQRHDSATAFGGNNNKSNNGSNINAMTMGGLPYSTSTSSSTATSGKGHNSSKMSHHNNMSQLFGESNDEDDNDDDDDYHNDDGLFDTTLSYRHTSNNSNMEYAARKVSYNNMPGSSGHQR